MSRIGNRKSGPITPTTVKGSPLSVIGRPTTAGSPPKRRCQSPCDITTTFSAPGTSSSGWSVRPSAAGAPSVANSPPETRSPGIRSVFSSPPRLPLQFVKAEKASSVRARSR
jgi:hypothetical protein